MSKTILSIICTITLSTFSNNAKNRGCNNNFWNINIRNIKNKAIPIKEKIKNYDKENITLQKENVTLRERIAIQKKENTRLQEKIRQEEQQQKKATDELERWTAESKRDAEFEASRSKQMFAEANNNIIREIEFYESWRQRTLNESRSICQEQLSWSRKGKAQKRQARQTLLQAESALSRQAYLERSRLQKLRINSDNILKQEIIRINNKIQNITSRIYHTSPTWNQAQKSFWNREKESLLRLIETWNDFRKTLQTNYTDLDALWAIVCEE